MTPAFAVHYLLADHVTTLILETYSLIRGKTVVVWMILDVKLGRFYVYCRSWGNVVTP